MLAARITALALDATSLVGPAPCFYNKLEGYYRWHLIVRSPAPEKLFAGMDLAQGWFLDIDPLDVL